jgi:hypothetical protein
MPISRGRATNGWRFSTSITTTGIMQEAFIRRRENVLIITPFASQLKAAETRLVNQDLSKKQRPARIIMG